jgi:signal transduction histidine kinase
MLEVSVIDNGNGIEKEYIDTLLSDSNFPKEGMIEGSGLSIRTAKRLLEMLDSTLHVESIFGMGSKFSFEIKQEVVCNDRA